MVGLAGDKADRCRKNSFQPRALSEHERQEMKDTLRSEEYRNQPPAEVHERLLEKGEAPCSVSTMHRILRKEGENGERRNQRPAQHNAIPRLKATAPNQVWTWDITKLPLVTQGVYLSLYAIIDLFSRYTVAWMISLKENSALAMQLMDEVIRNNMVYMRRGWNESHAPYPGRSVYLHCARAVERLSDG